MAVPRYDKSAFKGEGDTADIATWPIVEGPLDIVLFEGWMLGFQPVIPAESEMFEEAMQLVNKRLAVRVAPDALQLTAARLCARDCAAVLAAGVVVLTCNVDLRPAHVHVGCAANSAA